MMARGTKSVTAIIRLATLPRGMDKFFRLSERGTSVRMEIVGGATRLLQAVLLASLLSLAAHGSQVLTVATDGSAQYKSVMEAVKAAPAGSKAAPVVIRIKPGTYKELIHVQREKRHLWLVGEDAGKTVLTFDLNANRPGSDGKPLGTFRTPSTVIDADDFTAENIAFENSAGPVGQALAIRLAGDRAVFRNCRFLGWQDTILAERGRHYFTNCHIAGHVDFIFGGATSYFDHCQIHCLRSGCITAASTPEAQAFGFVFNHCAITGADPKVKTHLGRPWRPFAATVFLNTDMSSAVHSAGWDNWQQPEREKTARYAEYNNTGPGAAPARRAKWARQITAEEARSITIESVLRGNDGWNPAATPARLLPR